MPIYEFLCLSCHSKFEVLKASLPKGSLKCPKCGSGEVRYLFSSFGLGFNHGSGGGSSGVSPCSTCKSRNCSICG